MKKPTWALSFDPVTGKIHGIDKGDGKLRPYAGDSESIYIKEMDVMDWGIRTMRVLGILSMRQMILVLRLLRECQGRKKRFSTKEMAVLCQ